MRSFLPLSSQQSFQVQKHGRELKNCGEWMMNEQDVQTVLLVECDKKLRKVVAASLAQLGLRVLDAAGAEDALKILHEQESQILIVQGDAPADAMGSVIERFRGQSGSHKRAVVVTVAERLQDGWRKRYQPEVALYKPFDVRQLSRIVLSLMEGSTDEVDNMQLSGVMHD